MRRVGLEAATCFGWMMIMWYAIQIIPYMLHPLIAELFRCLHFFSLLTRIRKSYIIQSGTK